MIEPAPVITIDGPSGVGKGTVGLMLANQKGWHFLDSGALYRLLALLIQEKQLSRDPAVLSQAVLDMDVSFEESSQGMRVLLDGQEVTQAIRSSACGRLASEVGAFPLVRMSLLERQRAFRRLPGLVADGRDMGTVIFPDAFAKFYLNASVEARAERRYNQLKEQGIDANLEALLEEIKERDTRDMARSASPLKPAEDAVLIDTTTLSIENVVALIEEHLNSR